MLGDRYTNASLTHPIPQPEGSVAGSLNKTKKPVQNVGSVIGFVSPKSYRVVEPAVGVPADSAPQFFFFFF